MISDVLIIDDEVDICKLISGVLEDEGYATRYVNNSDDAMHSIKTRIPKVVILDIWLEGSKLDGLQLLDKIINYNSDIPVIIISGHGNIDIAVSAIKNGAYDYIEKPFKTEKLFLTVQKALENFSLKKELTQLKRLYIQPTEFIGISSVINDIRSSIDKLSKSDSRILITGATGTGKALAASLIHYNSKRSKSRFQTFNCSNIETNNVDKLLYGQEMLNGNSIKIGALEQCDGGTLYISNISDLSLEGQKKLLKVINDNKYLRVGGDLKQDFNVRIICSTKKDIPSCVGLGLFLNGLYDRIAISKLHIPSLADRRNDIGVLADYFINQICSEIASENKKISLNAIGILQSYNWPGNVRELRNNIERLIIITNENGYNDIDIDMIPSELKMKLPSNLNNRSDILISLNMKDAKDLFERDYLISQLARFNGNISKTAEFIHMERSALHRKLKYLGISTYDRKIN
jgi:two-component system, NtrC family, nitrogen regulation response regulator NtrX